MPLRGPGLILHGLYVWLLLPALRGTGRFSFPNEKIKCINGVIFINDEKYEDKYGFGTTTDFDEITLKDDEYFVLGDNRVVSKDSRMLGPIKEKYIEGTTNIILYPFNKIGKVK